MKISVLSEDEYEFIRGYYERLHRISPLTLDAFVSYVDHITDQMANQLRAIGTVELDCCLSVNTDFHISTFADPGRSLVIVGPVDPSLILKGLEIISGVLRENAMDFLVILDCALTFGADASGNCFVSDEHGSDLSGFPRERLSDAKEIIAAYQKRIEGMELS